MSNKKAPGKGAFLDSSSDGSGCQSQYSTEPPPIQPSNIFQQAATLGRGSITQRQLYTLDSLRNSMDSDRFNEFRNQCGIADFYPNWRLSKRQAAALIRVILAAQEARR